MSEHWLGVPTEDCPRCMSTYIGIHMTGKVIEEYPPKYEAVFTCRTCGWNSDPFLLVHEHLHDYIERYVVRGRGTS